MNKNLLRLLSVFLCTSVYNVSIAQCTIDQTYTGANTLQSPVGSNIAMPDGQSFEAGLTGPLSEVSLDLSATNPVCSLTSMDVQVDILDGDGIGGTVLDSEIFTIPIDFVRNMHTFTFSTPTTVTATQMYTVIITLVPAQDCGSGEPDLIWYFDFPTGFWAATGGTQYQNGVITSLGNTQYFNTCVGPTCTATTNSFTASNCYNYTVPSGDETYTMSGTYMDTIPNMAGCDSVLTIDVTILNANTSSFSEVSCSGSYTVPSGDETYSVDGVYMDTIPNMAGCDSVMTITVTIANESSSSIAQSSCSSITINSQTYTTSGIYTQVLVNSEGCDSTITLDLDINGFDLTITQNGSTLSSNITGVWFQWLDCNDGDAEIPGAYYIDFTPAVDGSYSVIMTNLSCTDTTACFTITNVGLDDNTTNLFAIYPNPTNGDLTISTSQVLTNASVKLVSLTGQVLQQENNVTGSIFNMNITEQSSGIYFVEINENGIVQRIKVVKN